MEKDIFLQIVKIEMYKHPELMEDVIRVASEGVLQKVKDNRKTAVEVQHSIAMLYDNQYGKLSKENQRKVNRAILVCDALEGTIFAEKVKERLEKLEK